MKALQLSLFNLSATVPLQHKYVYMSLLEFCQYASQQAMRVTVQTIRVKRVTRQAKWGSVRAKQAMKIWQLKKIVHKIYCTVLLMHSWLNLPFFIVFQHSAKQDIYLANN